MTKDKFQAARDEASEKHANERCNTKTDYWEFSERDFSAGAAWAREFDEKELEALRKILYVQDNKFEDLRAENARLREALKDILHSGNLAMQGKWDSTDEMKNKAYAALKEKTKGETK